MSVYYNGFYYDVNQPSRNRTVYAAEIYDSTRTTLVHREIRSNWSYTGAVAYARNWIDINSGATPGDIGEIEYDDLTKPVTPIQRPEPVTIDPVSPVLPPSEGDIPESSGDNGILETAGVFVVGVAKGTLIAAVPITAMAVAVGFMRRIVRFGVGVGS